MVELKSCPFCGSEASIACEQTFWTIRCPEEMCPAATTNGAFPKKEAIAAWNRRALTASTPATSLEGVDAAKEYPLDGMRVELDLLLMAVEADDPKAEIRLRVKDLITSAAAIGRAAPAAEVVKALDWDETDERWWGAQPFHGFCYEIRVTDRGGTRVRWPESGGWISFDGDLDAAKAAFQADFEARIRSCLASPKPLSAIEGER